MNRLFDDAFRGFDLAPFDFGRGFNRTLGWPNIEVSETDKEIKVTAELPGLEEKDIEVDLANDVLVIKARRRPKRRTRIGCSVSATTVASRAAFRWKTSKRTK
jgi:HSP20 family molecular chaperone IbpA